MTGIKKLNKELVTAAAFSVVDTTTLPVPIVALLLSKRNRPVPNWMVPAVEPPAKKASPHRTIGSWLETGSMEKASKVPAATERGVAMVSKRLSKNGI